MAVHKFVAGEDKKTSQKTSSLIKKTAAKAAQAKVEKEPRTGNNPFRALGQYFKGAWQELRQVRWPNRKQTWALTLAVIVFSLAIGGLIFLLDLGFTYLFKEIIL